MDAVLLAGRADADDIDGVAFCLEAAGQAARRSGHAEVFFFDIGDGLALRADHVMVVNAVHLHAQRPVVHAELAQHAAFDEEMDVFVNGCERDGGDALLDALIDLFRTGMAGHGAHHVIQNLALMRRGQPVIGAELTEGASLFRGGAGH